MLWGEVTNLYLLIGATNFRTVQNLLEVAYDLHRLL